MHRQPGWTLPVVFLLAAVWALLATPTGAEAADKPGFNVLFIAVDDLRPQLGCYGDRLVKSPNIDRLAKGGLVFNRAYCQQAVCSPSRTSLLTGRRPDTTRVYDLQTHFRKTIPDVVTLPEQFKRNGYFTRGLSKIYHGGLDDAPSWSVPHWRPRRPMWITKENTALIKRLREEARKAGKDLRKRQNRIRGPAYEAPDVPDNRLPDGATTDEAVKILRQIKDRPFFLAVGYLKPHLPFIAPKKYWDMYQREQFKLAANPFAPKGCPPVALHNFGELRSYHGIPKSGPVPDDLARTLIHGYYACVSFHDAQVGRLLDELDRLGLRDKTVVILWGDHGWQLGEHGLWCKHSNFETSAWSPLIISVPGQKSAGRKTDALVEFVDIFPSLCDISGVPLPDGLEGTSFKPLLDNPDRPWKKAAFSQYPRGARGVGRIMGYSARTDRYRYTEWLVRGTRKVHARELYDHETDPQENVNLAERPEQAERVRQLSKLLGAGWQAARPSEPRP